MPDAATGYTPAYPVQQPAYYGGALRVSNILIIYISTITVLEIYNF